MFNACKMSLILLTPTITLCFCPILTLTIGPHKYALVLGTFHANLIYVGPGSMGHQSQRIEFLWVQWYNVIGARTTGWAHSRLDQLCVPPITRNGAFSLSICQMLLWDVTFSQYSPLASDIVMEKVYLTAERTLRIGWNIMLTSESQLLFIWCTMK